MAYYSYNIIKSDNTLLTTVPPQAVDGTSSSLVLIGQGSVAFGQAFNDNFVRLLENFAAPTSPNAPLDGQLWYNTTTQTLGVRQFGGWSPLASQGWVETNFASTGTVAAQLQQAGFLTAQSLAAIITGDVTAYASTVGNTTTETLTLVPVTAAGSFSYPTITVDAKGRIIHAASNDPFLDATFTGNVNIVANGSGDPGNLTTTGSLSVNGGRIDITAATASANLYLHAPGGQGVLYSGETSGVYYIAMAPNPVGQNPLILWADGHVDINGPSLSVAGNFNGQNVSLNNGGGNCNLWLNSSNGGAVIFTDASYTGGGTHLCLSANGSTGANPLSVFPDGHVNVPGYLEVNNFLQADNGIISHGWVNVGTTDSAGAYRQGALYPAPVGGGNNNIALSANSNGALPIVLRDDGTIGVNGNIYWANDRFLKASDFSALVSSQGYQYIAGMMLQWGSFSSLADGVAHTYNFPISFPGTCLAMVVSFNGGSTPSGALGADPISGSQFTCQNTNVVSNGAGGYNYSLTWFFAIGY